MKAAASVQTTARFLLPWLRRSDFICDRIPGERGRTQSCSSNPCSGCACASWRGGQAHVTRGACRDGEAHASCLAGSLTSRASRSDLLVVSSVAHLWHGGLAGETAMHHLSLSLPLSLTHTHTHTRVCPLSLSHAHTHSLTRTHTLSPTHTYTPLLSQARQQCTRRRPAHSPPPSRCWRPRALRCRRATQRGGRLRTAPLPLQPRAPGANQPHREALISLQRARNPHESSEAPH